MVQKTVLNNGIRIVTEQVPTASSVTIGVWVESGSRHEPVAQGGISHFVEHMLFKGTPRRSAKAIAREIDSVGGILNGFTGREFSCFYAKVMGERLPLAVDLLADMVQHANFDIDEVEKERKVILQELSMLEDTPDDLVHDLCNRLIWGEHPLARSILGTERSVASLDREALLAFARQQYHGGNLVVSVAGQLQHDAVVNLIATTLGQLPSGRRHDNTAPQLGRHCAILERDLEQVHLCLAAGALPQNHPNRFAGFLLNTILGASMSSRLFQSVREERGLAYSIYSYLNTHSDAGSLVVYAGTAPEEAPHVVSLVLRELRRLCVEPVGSEELAAAKEQIKGGLLLSLESTDNCMTRMAKNEIYLGSHLQVDEVLQALFAVSGEDIQSLACEMLRDEWLNLQVLGAVSPADFPSCDLTLGLPAAGNC